MLLACSAPAAAEPDAQAGIDRLFAALARPAPTVTPFVERRPSALLDAPLELRGRLERPAPGTLVRIVEHPYRERTTIDDRRVTIERDGQRTRRFSLRRAPELAALLSAFQAMLDGDRARLDPHYTIAHQVDGDGWTLQLTPTAAKVRDKLTGVSLHGVGDQLDCIVVRQPDREPAPMLVGDAAERGDFERACRP